MFPDAMVQERQREVQRQRLAVRRVDRDVVPRWRRGAGRLLASLAVAVGVPRSERATTRCRVGAALTFAPPRS